MAQLAQVMTPPSSAKGTLNDSARPGKRNFLDKILRRKTSTTQRTPPRAGGVIGKSQYGDRQASTSPASRRSNLLRSGSVRSNRSRRHSFSEPQGFVDGDDTSLRDYDTYGEDFTDPTSEASSLNSLNSFDNVSKPFHGIDSGDKIKFPSLENNYDKIAIDIKSDEDPPWLGITYEALTSPKYIKTSKKNKHSPGVLGKLFLAQELTFADDENTSKNKEPHTFSPLSTDDESDVSTNSAEVAETPQGKQKQGSEIFIMEFSCDGKYLAAAGHDSVIKVWKVISSPLGRLESKNDERESHRSKKLKQRDRVYAQAPVFHQKPVKVFEGHSQSILSLNWSKNNFLISGSMDRTAKLWHVDKEECLQTFHHEDFVTSVKFHPNDDRFFVSGSLDNNVRLWSILENSVAYTRNLGGDVLITALVLTPDGEYCVVGGFNGSVFTLETKGLHVKGRFDIKERSIVHPFQKNGNKITGIKVFGNPLSVPGDEDPLSKWSFLLTTNDSKIRLVNTTQKKLVTRFKGLSNNSSSIVADISDDNRYIVSGSEDHWVYVWENNNSIINNKVKLAIKELVKEGKHHISDMLNKHKKYAKLVQDSKLMKLLADDPQDFIANENNSYAAFHAHHSRVNAAIFAPDNTRKLLDLSDDIIFDLIKRGKACNLTTEKKCRRDDHSQGARSNSTEGHIIVTTDQYGLIRVFRQDAARDIRKKFQSLHKSKLLPNGKEPRSTRPTRLDSNKSLMGKIATHGRSMSPTHEGYFNLKNRIHNKIKHSPSTPGLTKTFSSADVLSGNLSKGPPRVISSSSIMTQNLKPQISTPPTPMFNQSDISYDIDEEHLESPISSHDLAVHDNGSGRFTIKVQNADNFDSRDSAMTLNNGTPPSLNPSVSNSLASNQSRPANTPLQSSFIMPPTGHSSSSIPLIVKTDIGNLEDTNEVINFKTPVENAESFHEQVNNLSVKPSRPKSHKYWKGQ